MQRDNNLIAGLVPAGSLAALVGPTAAGAQFVCAAAATAAEPLGWGGSNAVGAPENVACGVARQRRPAEPASKGALVRVIEAHTSDLWCEIESCFG